MDGRLVRRLRGRARGAAAAVALCAALAAGVARGEDHLPEVDLWPLFYYDRDEDTGESEGEFLWPLGAWAHDAKESFVALRPLWSRRTVKARQESQSYYLLPFNSSTSRPGYSEAHHLWLYKHLFHSGPQGSESLFALLPFVVLRDRPEGGAAVFFPFFGDVRNWIGRKRIFFVLGPLFVLEDFGDAQKYSVLWPFFSWRTGGGGGGVRLWPLFGRRSDRRGEVTFVLWPFFHRMREVVAPGVERRIFYSWPSWYNEESPAGTLRGVLWPFFMHLAEKKGDRSRWTAPHPLVVFERAEGYRSTRVLPFFIATRSPDAATTSVLWPFFWWWEEQRGERSLRSFRFVPFLWSMRETQHNEERSAFMIWPLFKRVREFDGSVRTELPTFTMTARNDWWERHFAPFLRLVEYRRDAEGTRDVRLLWRFVRWRSGPRDRFAELTPLFAWYSGRRGAAGEESPRRRFTLLKGFFDYRRTAGGRSLTVLYVLPIWRPAGPAEGAR